MATNTSAVEVARTALAARAVDVLVTDLDGVLRHFDPSIWDELDRDLALPRGSAHAAILASPFLTEVTHGRATHAQWRDRARRDLVAAGATEAAARAAVDRWASTPATVDEEVLALLRDARADGVPTFVFTNGTDRVPEELANLGLDEITGADGAHLVNTADLGVTKPHRAAYAAAHRRVEEALGRPVPAPRVLFLDDTPGNIEGARSFGWHALGYRRSAKRVAGPGGVPHTVPMTDSSGQSDPQHRRSPASPASPARGSWREMVTWCDSLVLERTGQSAETWAERARAEGMAAETPLRAWLTEHGVTGYAANAVEWRVLGYPASFLKDADELLDAQYADRPHLRPIADAILAWAESRGARVQVRKTIASLTARRKFAEVSPLSKSAVTVVVRLDARLGAPFETFRTPDDDPFDQRVRLRSLEDLTDAVFAALTRALDESR